MNAATTQHLSAVPKGAAPETADAPATALKTIVKTALKKLGLGGGLLLANDENLSIMLFDAPQSKMDMITAAADIEQHTPLKVELRHASNFSQLEQNQFRSRGTSV